MALNKLKRIIYLFHITLFFHIYILEKKITLASSCPSQEIRLGGS